MDRSTNKAAVIPGVALRRKQTSRHLHVKGPSWLEWNYEVNISFPATTRLRVLDAQAWIEAMSVVVAESRNVQAELRTAATAKKRKR